MIDYCIKQRYMSVRNGKWYAAGKKGSSIYKKAKGLKWKRTTEIRAFCENKNTWVIIYGESLMAGVAGFGETPN